MNSSSVSVLPISLSESSGNQINQWGFFEMKSCPFKHRKVSAEMLKARVTH